MVKASRTNSVNGREMGKNTTCEKSNLTLFGVQTLIIIMIYSRSSIFYFLRQLGPREHSNELLGSTQGKKFPE
jgi:hypothetical protein